MFLALMSIFDWTLFIWTLCVWVRRTICVVRVEHIFQNDGRGGACVGFVYGAPNTLSQCTATATFFQEIVAVTAAVMWDCSWFHPEWLLLTFIFISQSILYSFQFWIVQSIGFSLHDIILDFDDIKIMILSRKISKPAIDIIIKHLNDSPPNKCLSTKRCKFLMVEIFLLYKV